MILLSEVGNNLCKIILWLTHDISSNEEDVLIKVKIRIAKMNIYLFLQLS